MNHESNKQTNKTKQKNSSTNIACKWVMSKEVAGLLKTFGCYLQKKQVSRQVFTSHWRTSSKNH